MAVFVTGCGLIGYWIVKGLIAQGEDVILYDIRPPKIVEQDLQKITFIKGDILDYPRLVEVFQKYGSRINGIIHTVGIIAGSQFIENPYRNATINIIGTLNVLELARVFKIKKIVYTSTCGVYGGGEGPFIESKTPINPTDLYTASKASSELLGFQYMNHWKIDFRCARLYFVYGPPALPSSRSLVIKVLFGPLEGLDNLKLDSGADQQIDFIYAKDAMKAVLLIYNEANPTSRIFNIGGGKAYKLSEVVSIVKKYSSAASIEIGPGYLFPPRGSNVDISLAKEKLGYEPEYTLEEGISEYAEWLKNTKRVEDG